MKGLRSTIILIVILAGLVGYIYYIDRNGGTNGADAKEKVFDSVPADDIEEVQIKLADGETSRLQKADNVWRLVEPVQAEADSSEMSSITSSLATIDVQRIVDENPSDLKQYGLEPARIEVAFRAKDQKEPRRILFGEKTPTGGDLYARVPDQKRVLLVSSFLDSTFNKDAFALRDKTILKFDRDKADGLEFVSGSTVIQLAKTGTEWRLVKPVAARADFGAVESIVARLASAKMERIVDAEGTNLAKYGLNKPSTTLTVMTGSSRATLSLGGTEDALVFAKDSSRPMVFAVAPTLKDDVIKEVAHYRRKDLFESRSFTANRIELRRGSEIQTFEKTKSGDKETWRNAAGKDVETAKIEDLLTKVTSLRAQSFEPGTHRSLKSPVLVVNVTYGDNKTEAITFGRDGTDVFASRSDEPDTAKLEAATSFDEAVKALDAMK